MTPRRLPASTGLLVMGASAALGIISALRGSPLLSLLAAVLVMAGVCL